MKKTFNNLKRDLKIGMNIKCIEHNIKPDRVGITGNICKVQSNAIVRNIEGKEIWLYYPNSANLVEYIDNRFSFYGAGFREMTNEEKYLREQMDKMDYWQEKNFAKKNNCEYLLGFEEKQGKKLDFNMRNNNLPCIRDNKIRGKLLYSFEIV